MSSFTRPDKGNSLLFFPDDYIILDIETTGLDPFFDEIIEIAMLHVVNGVAIESFQTLIQPERPISAAITDLTGITNEMVADAPSISEVMPSVLDFSRGKVVVGHNVNFDINFLYDVCEVLKLEPFSNDFVDTLRLSRRLLPELEHHRLSDLLDHFGLVPETAHRAMADVIATNDCLQIMRTMAPLLEKAPQRPAWRIPVTAKSIAADRDASLNNPNLIGKVFVITGELVSLTRRSALQQIVNGGGKCVDTVSRKVDYLVLGDFERVTVVKDGKSRKLKRAEYLQSKGDDIQIISEDILLDMLGLENSIKRSELNV